MMTKFSQRCQDLRNRMLRFNIESESKGSMKEANQMQHREVKQTNLNVSQLAPSASSNKNEKRARSKNRI